MDALDWYREAQRQTGPARYEALANLEYHLGRLDVAAARQAGLTVTEAPKSNEVARPTN